jgi:adenine-specific DNA-methyltransferase
MPASLGGCTDRSPPCWSGDAGQGGRRSGGGAGGLVLAKRYTPFAYKHTITETLWRTFALFSDSTIVLSYSSNAVPDIAAIEALLRQVKSEVEVRPVDHRYSFGTHAAARRRAVREYIITGR